jgi:hypothetical protein
VGNRYSVVRVVTHQEVETHVSVVQWNSWDAEHLRTVHSGYADAYVLFEGGQTSLSEVVTSLPWLKIRVKTVLFVAQIDQSTQITFARQLGVWSRTTIRVTAHETFAHIDTEYEFALRGLQKLLKPILRRMIPRWNEVVWNEDLPVKLRRERVLQLGFKDFAGLPESISERIASERNTMIPVLRPVDSSINDHPLYTHSLERISIQNLRQSTRT